MFCKTLCFVNPSFAILSLALDWFLGSWVSREIFEDKAQKGRVKEGVLFLYRKVFESYPQILGISYRILYTGTYRNKECKTVYAYFQDSLCVKTPSFPRQFMRG